MMTDFSWALDQLKKFNKLVSKNKNLYRLFVAGEYNFLQAYQARIFFELAEIYKREKRGTEYGHRGSASGASVSVRLRQLLAILISLLGYIFLIISRRRVLVFGADKNTFPRYHCDFRMANLYRYLFENKIEFVELFHVVFKDDFMELAIKRHRPAMYLEVFDIFYKISCRLGFLREGQENLNLDLINFDSTEEEAVFKPILEKYTRLIDASKFKIHLLRRLLSVTGVEVLIATADTRNSNELVAACNESGIKTYSFQSGNISKYNIGLLNYFGEEGRLIKPQKMMAESGYWKNELLRLGTYFSEQEIEVGGNQKEDYSSREVFDCNEREGKKLTILIPYEIAAPKEEILRYIKKFLTLPDVRVVFKFRADRNLSEQAADYGVDGTMENLLLITDLKEIDRFDVVAGTYSTFLYEMIGKLKPVAILKTSLDYGEGMIINNLAEEVDINDQNLRKRLELVGGTDRPTLMKRRDTLYGDLVPLDQTLDKILVEGL